MGRSTVILRVVDGSFGKLFAKSVKVIARRGLVRGKYLRSISFLGATRRNSECSAKTRFLRVIEPRLTIISYSTAGACKRPSPSALRQLGGDKDEIVVAESYKTIAVIGKGSISTFGQVGWSPYKSIGDGGR